MRLPALFFLAALFSTCAVESSRPLSPPEKAKPERAFLGEWNSNDAGGKPLAVRFEARAGGVMAVTLFQGEGDEAISLEGHVTELGPLRMLNLRALEKGSPRGAWTFVRFVFAADGSLQTWLLNDKVISAAVGAGTLKGKGGKYGGTVLDETPERLVSYLRGQKPEVVFAPLATFRKK